MTEDFWKAFAKEAISNYIDEVLADLEEVWEYISKGKAGSKVFEFIEKKEEKWEKRKDHD